MGWIEAGKSLDRIARDYGMKNYDEAVKRAMRENPSLALEYNNAVADAEPAVATVSFKKDYRMSASEQAMALAQADREQNRKLAGDLLAHHAQALAGSNQRGYPNQVNPERFRACMAELMGAFPDLAECYSSGNVAPDNWALLATLIPSITNEVKRVHGVDGYNLR